MSTNPFLNDDGIPRWTAETVTWAIRREPEMLGGKLGWDPAGQGMTLNGAPLGAGGTCDLIAGVQVEVSVNFARRQYTGKGWDNEVAAYARRCVPPMRVTRLALEYLARLGT